MIFLHCLDFPVFRNMYFCTNLMENTCNKTMLENVVIYWRSCNEQWQLLTENENKDGSELMIHFIKAIHWCTKARYSVSVFCCSGHLHWRVSATGQLHLLHQWQCCWTMAMQLSAKRYFEKCFFQTLRYFFSIHIDLDFWIRLGQRPLCITLERNWANGYYMILHWSEAAVWSSSMRVQCLGKGKKGCVKSET